jgi:hypothetical protein
VADRVERAAQAVGETIGKVEGATLAVGTRARQGIGEAARCSTPGRRWCQCAVGAEWGRSGGSISPSVSSSPQERVRGVGGRNARCRVFTTGTRAGVVENE